MRTLGAYLRRVWIKSIAIFVWVWGVGVHLGMGALLLTSSVALPAEKLEDKARAFTRSQEYDFIAWTLETLGFKLRASALGAAGYMSYAQQRRAVQQYLRLVEDIFAAEDQVRRIYADPQVSDPQTASAGLRRELARLQQERGQRAMLVESVMQDQVNQAANELGLTLGGQAIPPVLYHSTPLPLLLVISPRQVIRMEGSLNLLPGLSLDQQVALEAQTARALNVSTLIEPIGGVGTYPTMVQETSSLDWLAEVVSHEWIHNYLTLRPLGIRVMDTAELRIMNETTASIAGKEIRQRLLELYYPEMLPAPQPANPAATAAPASSKADQPAAPPPFNFSKEMHTTRVQADELLKAGKIEEAEAYMEARRKMFVEHGYAGLRKLNQAYFAFHGNYADQPLSAAGEDPVGAAVRKLRSQSASLAAFLARIAWMTSFTELQAAVR